MATQTTPQTTRTGPPAAQPGVDVPAINEAAAQEFAGRAIEVFNHASVALLTSIGHQTGLFEALVGLPPSTSEEIADAAGLHERYVREWLNGMTTAQFVLYDSEAHTYWLPPEHALSLTTAGGAQNLGPMMAFVALLGEVEQPIIECFRNGGGLSYADYPRFHAFMAASSAAVVDDALLDETLPTAPGVVDRLREGIDVLDIGCGQGHAINVMAQAFPASRFVGYDFSEEAIDRARAEAADLGVANARFEVVDVAGLRETAAYDLVTAFDAIHDQADPTGALAGARRALRPGGTFLMVDIKASSNVEDNIALPWAAFVYTVSTMHCMSVSLGLDGAGLGTAWGRQLATSMLRDAGFTDIEVHEPETDPLNLYYVARP
jgi:SAM-dependent methyltransferase